MKHFITRAIITLFVLSGIFFISQSCSAAASDHTPYVNQPSIYGQSDQKTAYVNPAFGMQSQAHPVSLTQLRTGYTRGEIRAMPITARPNRPGHIIGNTVRRRAGVNY